jgi:transposase
MKDPQLDALAREVKKLTARVGALEKLLERILRQRPVSEKQLYRALKSCGVTAPGIHG